MQSVSKSQTAPTGLLTPDDPPAYSVRNGEGTGPGVIVCDHASNRVPMRLKTLGLPDTSLQKHIAYDIGAQALAEITSDRLDLPALFGGYSRLVIDLNRPEEDYTCIREIYDGAVIPGNRRLSDRQRLDRFTELLRPYHAAVEETIARKCASTPVPAILSMHSCTDKYRGQTRPWHIGVLSNRDRRMADRVLDRLIAHRPDLTIGDNKPYSGMDPYGHTVERHALPQGRPNVLFEVRQDLIAKPAGQREFGDLLATVLSEVLGDPSLFTRFQG